MAKKYLVSVPVNVPFNWEIEIEATNEEEAIKKAGDLFNENTMNGDLKETDAPVSLTNNFEAFTTAEETK